MLKGSSLVLTTDNKTYNKIPYTSFLYKNFRIDTCSQSVSKSVVILGLFLLVWVLVSLSQSSWYEHMSLKILRHTHEIFSISEDMSKNHRTQFSEVKMSKILLGLEPSQVQNDVASCSEPLPLSSISSDIDWEICC